MDKGHLALIGSPRLGPHPHLRLVSHLEPAQLILEDIDVDPYPAQIGDEVELVLGRHILAIPRADVHDAPLEGGVNMELFLDLARLDQLLDLMLGYIEKLQALQGAVENGLGAALHLDGGAIAYRFPVIQRHQILLLGRHQLG